MKKSGTPIGAVPGSESENENGELDGVGKPPVLVVVRVLLVVVSVAGAVVARDVDLFALVRLLLLLLVPVLLVRVVLVLLVRVGLVVVGVACEEPWCAPDRPVRCGGGCFVGLMVVLVRVREEAVLDVSELEVALLWALEVVLVLELEAVVLELVLDVEVEVVDVGTQDSLDATIGWVTGSFIADTGVPGGTLTSNVSVRPFFNLTFTVH